MRSEYPPSSSTFGTWAPLPKGPNHLSAEEIAESHRLRLMAAITYEVSGRGWANVSISDVVSAAGVSRTAFYENFADKEECLLKAYEVYSQGVARQVADAYDPQLPWVEMTEAALTAFVDKLQGDIRATRTFYVEMESAGPEARERRRNGAVVFAGMLKFQHGIAMAQDPRLNPIPDPIFDGLVLGIREIIRNKLDEPGDPDLTALTESFVAWIVAVTRGID